MPGKPKMTRNWMPPPLNVVGWSAPNKPLPVFRTLPLPVQSPVPRSLLPLWALTPPPSPRIPDTGRTRTPPPDRPRPIGMHPGPPLTEPSSSTGLRPPLLPLLAQYMPALSKDQWKANLLLRPQWARAKAHPKAPKGMPPPKFKILLFSPLHPKKVKMLPPKGERKARIRARTRVAIKARVKVKVRTKKVDRTRSPPFRLVLGRVFNLLLFFFASLTRSCPRSPPFRTVRGLSMILCSLLYIHVTSFWPLSSRRNGSSASSLHHLGWPWLGAPFLRWLPSWVF